MRARTKLFSGVGLIAVNLFVGWCAVRPSGVNGQRSFGGYRLDLDVYRIGSTVWRHGGSLYGVLPSTARGFNSPRLHHNGRCPAPRPVISRSSGMTGLAV
jgi:hypothetical protein